MALQTRSNEPRQRRVSSMVPKGTESRAVSAQPASVLDVNEPNFPEIMTPRQAGKYLGGVSTSFLAKLRMTKNRHRGPAFAKIGRVVLYRRADLDRWIASRMVEGT